LLRVSSPLGEVKLLDGAPGILDGAFAESPPRQRIFKKKETAFAESPTRQRIFEKTKNVFAESPPSANNFQKNKNQSLPRAPIGK
jgi:hypothetical protein